VDLEYSLYTISSVRSYLCQMLEAHTLISVIRDDRCRLSQQPCTRRIYPPPSTRSLHPDPFATPPLCWHRRSTLRNTRSCTGRLYHNAPTPLRCLEEIKAYATKDVATAQWAIWVKYAAATSATTRYAAATRYAGTSAIISLITWDTTMVLSRAESSGVEAPGV